jgi:hypothetical protein
MYKNKFLILTVFSILVAGSFMPLARVYAGSEKWIDATHILMREIELPERTRARAAAGLSFADIDPDQPAREKKLGQKDNFWVRNVANGQFEQIVANLRAIGKHCYVYVAEDQTVSQNAISKVQTKFDSVIYPVNTTHFGHEWKPGIDGDNKVYLLMSDIKDGYQNPSDGYVAGYFFAGDEMLQNEFPTHSKVKSNEKEIIYLDTYPSKPDSADYMEIVAHEFQHMIHYNQDNKEATWVNEGCSQIAPVLCGFTAPGHYKLLKDSTDRSLNNWAKWDPMPDYGQVYIWNQYILEVLQKKGLNPADFFRSLASSKKTSNVGYIEAFSKFDLSFSEMFTDFSLANHLNDRKIGDGRFAYQASHLKKFKLPPTKEITNFPAHEKDSVNIWSSDSFTADIANLSGNLKVSFSGYRRFLGPTYPYFRLAVILKDKSNHAKPILSFMKLIQNPADKNRLIGSANIKCDGTYDQLVCVIMALAPEEFDDAQYMPASPFIYDLRMETDSVFAATTTGSLNMQYFVDKINSTAEMQNSENAVRIRENYAHQLLMTIRNELESGSFASVDAFIEAADANYLLAPFARDISGMLRFYLSQSQAQISKDDLQARIEILDSF